jgi:hypothetical protein
MEPESELIRLITAALRRAREEATTTLAPNTTDKRRLALAITKLEEALLWTKAAQNTGIYPHGEGLIPT